MPTTQLTYDSTISSNWDTDIANIAANLLVKNKIIGLYNGRSEFGKRSLGHRSILSPATNTSFVNELNERLNRSDFMPFAPVTLFSDSHLSYSDYKDTDLNTNFMTTCYNCNDFLKTKSPAVVHVDSTARMQTVESNNQPFHSILSSFKDMTGTSVLLNTSFNVAGEPIVETPGDAIRCFLGTNIDILYLNKIKIVK